MSKETKKLSYLRKDDQDQSQLYRTAIGDWTSFFTLLNYAKSFKKVFFAALSLILLSSLFSIFAARATGELVQWGFVEKDVNAAFFYASLILGCEALALGLMWAGRRWLVRTSSLTILKIREQLFEHLQWLPMEYYDRQPEGRVVTRLTHDVEGLENFFTHSLGRLANALFMVFIAALAMLVTDFKLGGILVLAMFPAAFFIYLTRTKVRHVNREMSKCSSALNSKLSEFLSGLEVIRSMGLESWSKREYQGAVDDQLGASLRANALFATTRPFISLLCSLPLIGLVWVGGQQVLAGALSVGLFVTFIRYCERFFMPIMTLARELHVIQQAFTSAERLASFLGERTENAILGEDGNTSFTESHESFATHGDIRFQNVWMAYQGKEWVLNDVDFHIHAGERIGLVGHTGCGKTTTVSLLSRLYEYQHGEIYLDGTPLREFSRLELRKNVGFVSQDSIIFHSSLRQNLTTDSDVGDEEILNACRETGLDDLFQRGQLTLDSTIYEGGSNLSSGEKQLISLTRILLRNPRVLILDEATAHIDPHYEQVIHRAVDKMMLGRTCLMIAHRLDTLEHCDRIFVFSEGRLVESGP